MTFIATLVVLLETLVASSGLIPRRSFTAIVAGFLLVSFSGLSLVCVSYLIVRHLLRLRRLGAASLVVLISGLVGAVPAASIAVQLSRH